MVTSDLIGGGNIEPRGLEEEMRSSYLDYAMSVIVGRALPDVRDGLKPVHRRVLYTMYENGLQPNRPYRKSATVEMSYLCPGLCAAGFRASWSSWCFSVQGALPRKT